MRTLRRHWFEFCLAVLVVALAVLTLVNREWIEAGFGVDPYEGSLEWGAVFATASVAAISGLAARAQRRRVAASPT